MVHPPRRRYTTEREESLCHEYLQEGTNVLKQKLMKSCRAEENVETQLESVFRWVRSEVKIVHDRSHGAISKGGVCKSE